VTDPGLLDAPDAAAATDVDGGDRAAAARARPGAGLSALLEAIRRDLADGVYHPRERLVEADLVDRYGTTRAAVRDALIQLASEGLVERSPNRGARVRGMSLEEAIEIAEVRRALEALCSGLAAQRATPPERLRILGLSKTLQQAAADGRVDDYLYANAEFHRLIVDLSGHAIAQGILGSFRHRPIDRFFPQPFRARPPTVSVDQHERIAAAVAAGDIEGAEREMHDHLTGLVETLRGYEERSGPQRA
jgi:DNA-binding GntR family transcriptional regulator